MKTNPSLYFSNKLAKKELEDSSYKKILKYLGINPTKERKDYYNVDFILPRKEIKEDSGV